MIGAVKDDPLATIDVSLVDVTTALSVVGKDPATGVPHIYEHGISESEVEEVLDNPTQDLRGQNHSRIAIGQTAAGRYLKVIYAVDPWPDACS